MVADPRPLQLLTVLPTCPPVCVASLEEAGRALVKREWEGILISGATRKLCLLPMPS